MKATWKSRFFKMALSLGDSAEDSELIHSRLDEHCP
jgi:hypothetical protein